MNLKTIAIAAVLMAAALTGLLATSPLAYAEGGDSSDTYTEEYSETDIVGSGDAYSYGYGTQNIN
jgi:hypothetical protein